MSDTVDIGAARIRLIVDSTDMQAALAQGKSYVANFGSAAQASYDKTEKGTRRAADALLDYVSALGSADTTMTRLIKTASKMGVEKPVIDDATAAWQLYQEKIEAAADAQVDAAANALKVQAAYKDLITTQAQAEIQAGKTASALAAQNFSNLGQSRAANSQQQFNSLVAPGLSTEGQSYAAQESAQAFLQLIEQQESAEAALNEALTQQLTLQEAINEARQAQNATNAQQDYNKLLGIPDQQQDLALIEARKNATAAFLPMLEEEAKLEAENNALVGKQQAFLAELEALAATAGKTGTELQQLRAAQLGISEQAAPLIKSVADANSQISSGTISAKQYAFALKGLPAQFTDIVVSLQGGQRPLTVLLQQGGQIKDMFGGVGAAIKVVATETLKIVTNPYLVLAGVVAGLAVAAFEATSRMTDLAVATAKGNQVAGSAQGLSDLADSLAKIGSGTSISNADAAVENLAAAGKLSGDNFTEAAQASARWATVTGQSVDEVASKFNELAVNPLNAVYDGTLKVTDAQYAELVALDRTGDKIGEVALAVKLYQQQVNDNSDEVQKNLSAGAQGWIDLKNAITDATHELGNWVTTSAGLVFNGFRNFGKGNPNGDFTAGGDFQVPGDDSPAIPDPAQHTTSGFGGVGTDQAANSLGTNTKLTAAQTQANEAMGKSYDELGTKQQKFNADLLLLQGSLRATSAGWKANHDIIVSTTGALSGAGYDKLYNGLRLKVFGQNEGGDPTKDILQYQKTALDMLKVIGDAESALYANGDISAEEYYGSLDKLAEDSAAVQLLTINKEIAALTGRANQESKIKELIAERATVAQTLSAQTIKNAQDETKAIAARNAAYENYVQSLADANNQLSRQGDQAAAAVGTGSRESVLSNAQSNAIYQEALAERAAQQKVDQLPNDGSDHSAAQAEADKDKAAAAAALSTQLDILQGNYKSLTAAESSFLNGSTKAWQDWSDNVANQAATASKITTDFLNGLSQSIVTAATKGTLSFKSLFTSLETDVIEAGAKIAEQKAITSLLSGINGGSSASGDYGTNFSGWATSLGALLFSAKGNAFGGGTGLSAYRNSIVKSPTVFPFAAGGVPNVGVMGEKPGSPGEAIMPLTRTSNGDLGVKVSGADQQRPAPNIYQTFVVPGAQSRQTQDQLAIKTFGAASRAARRN